MFDWPRKLVCMFLFALKCLALGGIWVFWYSITMEDGGIRNPHWWRFRNKSGSIHNVVIQCHNHSEVSNGNLLIMVDQHSQWCYLGLEYGATIQLYDRTPLPAWYGCGERSRSHCMLPERAQTSQMTLWPPFFNLITMVQVKEEAGRSQFHRGTVNPRPLRSMRK